MNNKIFCKLCGMPADGFCSVSSLLHQPLCNKCVESLYIGWRPFDEIDKEVCEFIQRRFKCDCSWKTGNCYYFAIILKDRFKDLKPELYYDTLEGHFICRIHSTFYDWSGIVYHDSEYINKYVIKWSDFKEYDECQYSRIIKDVIK